MAVTSPFSTYCTNAGFLVAITCGVLCGSSANCTLSPQTAYVLIWEIWPSSSAFILSYPHPLQGDTIALCLGGVLARRLKPPHRLPHWEVVSLPPQTSSLSAPRSSPSPDRCQVGLGQIGTAAAPADALAQENFVGTWIFQIALLESLLTWWGVQPSPQ